MLRSSVNSLTRLALNTETWKCGQSAFALEFVRWRRKPIWLPTAKSKMNRVHERKYQSPEEKEELKRLYNNYHLQMRSLMQYFREEAQRKELTSTADHIVLTPEQEEEEFQRCMSLNDEWNAKIAAEREQRLAKEREERKADILRRLELAKQREKERMDKIEEQVRREKELARTFITREKIDDAINEALANPVDYNYSIDLRGNKYLGRTTLPGGASGGGAAALPEDNDETKQAEAQN